MSERNFTRTLITLVVLSEEPIPEDESLGSILEGADTGPYVLGAVGKTADALDYQAMRQELLEAGNDGTFFDLEDEVAVAPTRYYEPPADTAGTVFEPTSDTFGPIMAALQAGEFETAARLTKQLAERHS